VLIVTLLAAVAVIIVAYNMLGNDGANENGSTQNITSTQMKVLLETSKGNITIQLRDDMPITTENFKNLVQQGVYNNTIFHRVIDDFMIQGGDPTGTGYGDPSIPNIKDEFSENPENNKNKRGTIAMANTGDPNSGSSQFFINVVYKSHLDNKHPVFGEVIEGMDVVDRISEVPTDGDPPNGANKPLEDVTLIKAHLID
jgi:peptidylprolyl isomerase